MEGDAGMDSPELRVRGSALVVQGRPVFRTVCERCQLPPRLACFAKRRRNIHPPTAVVETSLGPPITSMAFIPI